MKLLLSSLLFVSCASSAWVEKIPAFEKQTWRICTKEIDGIEKHLKGFCYISKEVRGRFLRSDLIRQKHYFCEFTDEACLSRHAYSGKKLKR